MSITRNHTAVDRYARFLFTFAGFRISVFGNPSTQERLKWTSSIFHISEKHTLHGSY